MRLQTMKEQDPGFKKLQAEHRERLKELATINKTTNILKEGKSIEESLQQIALILPKGWQFPEHTVARIFYNGKEFSSPGFVQTSWNQKQSFETVEDKKGFVEVCYTRKFQEEDEGPFLNEERDLIENLTNLISAFISRVSAQKFIQRDRYAEEKITDKKQLYKESPIASRKLLQQFLNKNNFDRDIYHDLMTFKVKEILLVANLYDAYSIEKEGRFSEHVLGEYHQLNLTSVPRITGVSSPEEAFEQLENKHFDLIIIMLGADKKTPLELSANIKNEYPYIPIFLLLNNNRDIEYYERNKKTAKGIDRIFVWNGDSRIFFSMIKLVEDKINLENDTQIGLVRVILLVEDSPKYYSRYLPMLYKIVMEQTKRIIEDVSTDELYKVLRMRARPKIILASTYEEAMEIIDYYKDYLLCLITDVEYERKGNSDSRAGFELVKYARNEIKGLPTIIQSSNTDNVEKAHELQSTFIDKNSESLLQDFQSFITYYLGFGNFVYRDKFGRQIGVARSLKEFEKQLQTIPDESLIYHARKDHFSMWLMARGEIQAAKILNPYKITDFESPKKLREVLIDVIQKFRNEQNKGKIIPFEESAITDESNVVSLSGGSMGGKGRGLAFINTLIYNYDFSQHVTNINIKAPKTSVIGTDEFEYFMIRNKLQDKVLKTENYEKIKKLFMDGKLTDTLTKRLKILLRKIKKPLAVRSSGLFEDSLMQPFAGIFETYILPNNHPDLNVRLQHLTNAIKLVFASTFSDTARGYIQAINYRIEEEKMAVIIQEVVGNQYEDFFYPHISGVAQSFNYYPFAHMKPEEGFAVAALGLGKYVVDGDKAYRFSPKYPDLEINTPKDQFRNSQLKFFAVDLKKKNLNLLEGDTAGLRLLDIDTAEMHGTLKHCASVYDPDNNTIYPGLSKSGPRIVNFANILKYNYIPLAKTIEAVLDVVKEAIGSAVEIEFAVDLNKDKYNRASFYLLQIKPLIGSEQDYNIDMEKINRDAIVLYTEKGMGNGQIRDLQDVIYFKREAFDKSKTETMAREIDMLNKRMIKQDRKYVLIGPGRWGTRDRWIGIPVKWPQISAARIIVETDFEDYPLDASSGSHFFHNVTSMNVGYFTVQTSVSNAYIKYDVLDKQPLVEETEYFRHIRFEEPFKILMDGKKRISMIVNNHENNGNEKS
ncbi:MAG: pyruvate, phosphate dikinase [Bacteroidales bacterium]|nr:pyruvate, phosphate dikinase [Bacteroidales bacterium]MCF8345431.1 pyruvate, phosphate dikinase [Bacteroidales bacterium]MCF8375954.1 pyruvate, phosphate dikinase [Bacteroidales bacterium]MCF8400442.1 pyruvate, phosphate dikinase [Bacteroidales bacterium]